jgi:hypothetical protein
MVSEQASALALALARAAEGLSQKLASLHACMVSHSTSGSSARGSDQDGESKRVILLALWHG